MDDVALGGDTHTGFDELYRPEVRRSPQAYYRKVRDATPVIRTPSIVSGVHDGAGGYADSSDKTLIWVAKRSDIDTGLRIELRVSLREWHRRIPDYHIPDDVELDFLPLVPMAPRQLDHLPLVFDQVVG